MMNNTLGLYIHIPFCMSKCPYCDFYSITDRSLLRRYVYALSLHMEDYTQAAESYTVDSVFIGGGTPTVLPCDRIIDILEYSRRYFTISCDAEITVEANPATVSLSDLKRMRRAGINRLSMGLQSANNSELAALGRVHTFEDFVKSYKAARKAGFDNINIDLMYGIPGQTGDSFTNTLSQVCALDPEHISAYSLKIEEGTPFAEKKDSLSLPSEDAECDMYFNAVKYLAERGYAQYEISNFSKPGKRCIHNLRYWNCKEYLGFGPGAHSYFHGRRFAFRRDIEGYINNLENPSLRLNMLSEDYAIDASERMGEYVMLRLRLTDGINTDDFAAAFGVSFERMFGEALSEYISGGYVERVGRVYRFTVKGMYVSNYILSSILDFDSDIISGVADGSDK